jgi:hypothetical protein
MSHALANRGADRPGAQVRTVARAVPQLAQVASTLNRSPHTQALIQRRATLQNGSAHPVIQRKTAVKYQTQSVGYTDAGGTHHVERVGSVADAYIDATDAVTGSAPNSAKQQPDMYSTLKAKYGQTFVRGHLFNDNLGGVGEIYNLFPITYSANSEHKITAEGHLKRYVRAELDAKDQNLGGPYFVRYRVFAVPSNGADLTVDARAQLQCEMVSMNSTRGNGASETWRIFSEPQAKVAAIGDRSAKDDYQNKGLGEFGSYQSGEHDSSRHSRERSTVDGWKGNKDSRFAEGGFEAFSQLVLLKNKLLADLETELDKYPVFSDILFDALERFRKALKSAHDEETVRGVAESIGNGLRKYGYEQSMSIFLQNLGNWLTPIPISTKDKQDIWDHAKLTLSAQTSLVGIHSIEGDLAKEIQERVKSLLPTDQTPPQELPKTDDSN